MQQVDEDAQPLLDNRVRPAAFDVDDEADAAGIVLVGRVVQTDTARRATPARLPRCGVPNAAAALGAPRWGPRRLLPFLRNAGVGPFVEGQRISCRHSLGTPFHGGYREAV